jgi:hypothetical protein
MVERCLKGAESMPSCSRHGAWPGLPPFSVCVVILVWSCQCQVSLSLCRCPSSCSSLTTRNQCLMQLEQGRNHWWSSEAELLLLKNGWCTGASARYQYDSMDMKLSSYSLHVLHRIPGQKVVFNHHFFYLEIRNNLQFLAPSLCVPNSVLACVILIWVRRFIQRKYCSWYLRALIFDSDPRLLFPWFRISFEMQVLEYVPGSIEYLIVSFCWFL